MFKEFSSKFKVNDTCEVKHGSLTIPFESTGLNEFFLNYSGSSFNGGLYRVHALQDISKWNELVGEAFPDFSRRIFCFGYDWLGRQFALDSNRLENGEPLVLLLEPGTGEVLEIPVNFINFHEVELVNYINEALSEDFFNEWISNGNDAPMHDQCIGYKKPLFLGGVDLIENLEATNLDVYWGISAQLIEKVRGLPVGTAIDDVSIS